jgi:hypothetical protein
MKPWVHVAYGVLVGAGLTFGATYLALRPTAQFWQHVPYVGAASEARLNLKALGYFDAGDVASARQVAEAQLMINEVALSDYESAVPASKIDPSVVATKRAIADYRRGAQSP